MLQYHESCMGFHFIGSSPLPRPRTCSFAHQSKCFQVMLFARLDTKEEVTSCLVELQQEQTFSRVDTWEEFQTRKRSLPGKCGRRAFHEGEAVLTNTGDAGPGGKFVGVESHGPDWSKLPSADKSPNIVREGSPLTLSKLNSLEPLIYATEIYSTPTICFALCCVLGTKC